MSCWVCATSQQRGLRGACRWAQPSTAAAATLAVIAANVCSSATTRAKRRSLKRTDIASLFSLISDAGPRCEIRSESRVLTYAIEQATAAVWNPGTGLNPATGTVSHLTPVCSLQGLAGLKWVM
jgi:hypothetical protein